MPKFKLTNLGRTRVLLVCGRGLTGSDKTESAVPGLCKIRSEFLLETTEGISEAQ